MNRNLTHRFPKWLVDERYEIHFAPTLEKPFTVTIFDRVAARFAGSGHSIAEAARAAHKERGT